MTGQDNGEWAILELMGHRQLAGLVREVVLFGQAMIEIEIPGDGDTPGFTQRYHPNAMYCLTPTTEAVARGYAARRYTARNHHDQLALLIAPEPAVPFGDDEDQDNDEIMEPYDDEGGDELPSDRLPF